MLNIKMKLDVPFPGYGTQGPGDIMMEGAYPMNSAPSYSDLWRASPLHHMGKTSGDLMSFGSPRSSQPGPPPVSLELPSFTVPPIEIEPLPNIFSLGSCPPTYKELSVFKEKGPHDIADALLSLKHAVVHPGQVGGPLSPLSPGLPPSLPQSMASPVMSSGPLSYHQTPMMSGYGRDALPSLQYGGPQYGATSHGPGQYGDPGVHSQLGGAGSPHGQGQASMFPAMSVNVSMSMNVGMPTGMGQCGLGPAGPEPQWCPPTPCGARVTHSPGLTQYSPGQTYHVQAQYPTSYGHTPAQSQPYPSYNFPDFRSPHNFKDTSFRSPDYKDPSSSRFYTLSPLRRQHMSPGRQLPISSIQSQPEASKPNLCRICGKTYARPSTLKTHMRTHSGEKPYRCSTCAKSFSQAANLTAHIRTHSGEKPFRCPVCERRFSQSSSVTTHMRTHSGERPYRCRMCKKAFSDSSTLTKHLRIHSGEKPYQCKLCLLRFSQSGNLNRHMRVHANTA